MIKIISRRERVETVSYRRNFETRPGSGCSFDCDAQGNVLPLKYEAAQKNLAECLTGTLHGKPVTDSGPVENHSSYVNPAVGLCECGEKVYLSNFTNTCECGADYNMSGQLLAPREQWGEETGEDASDIQGL